MSLVRSLSRPLTRGLTRNLNGADEELPLIQTISFVGSSSTDYMNVVGTTRSNYLRSTGMHLLGKMKGRVYPMWNPTGGSYGLTPGVGTYEFGTFGATIPTISTNHLAELNASRGDLIFIHAGMNDLYSGNQASQMMTSMETFVAALKAAGHSNIAIAGVTPRTSADNPTAGGKTLAVRTIEANDLLRPWCATQGIPFCDWHSVVADGSGFLQSQYTYDVIHVNVLGGQVLADFMATFLEENYRMNPSPYDADFIGTLNPESNFSGFTAFTSGAGASISKSTVAADDGLGNWTRITLSQPTPSSSLAQVYRNNIGIPAVWGHVDGELLQTVLECRLVSSGYSFSMNCEPQNGLHSAVTSLNQNNIDAWQPFHGVFFGQPAAANASTRFNMEIRLRGSAVVLDVRRYGFRKVNSIVPPYL